MKVNIDFSIFSKDKGAFGNITGSIELAVVPQSGDTIVFDFPVGGVTVDSSLFNGVMKVTDRILSANSGADGVSISLNDIVVGTEEDAATVARYLEKGFNLFATIYNEETN